MTARNLYKPEQSEFLGQSRVPGMLMRQCYVFRTVDIGFADRYIGGIDLQRNLLSQSLKRVWIQELVGALCGLKVDIVD